jgi:hypothetical protein
LGVFDTTVKDVSDRVGRLLGKLSANDGVDVGDVTVNNASGGSAVNIQDGGNSITIDGSVSVTGALPAGTNAIGKLSANDGVDVGDVTINNSSINVHQAAPSATTDTTTFASSATPPVSVTLTGLGGSGGVSVLVYGTYGVGAVLNFEVSDDGTNWFLSRANRIDQTLGTTTTESASGVIGANLLRMWVAPLYGTSQFRVRMSTAPSSGTISVRLLPLALPSDMGVSQSVNVVNTGASQALNIQDGGNSVTVDSLQLPLSLVNGRLDVNVGTALPAGANAIGKLTANDGVDVGDVTINNALGASAVNVQDGGNILSVDDGAGSITVDGTFWQATQPVSLAAGATNVAKAEDGASADADVGVPAMAVRKATPANTSGTDGDYEMLQMSAGRLWASATVDQATASNLNAQVVGEVAHDGVDAGNPQKVGGQARTTLPTAVQDADRVNAMYDKWGRAVVTLAPVDVLTSAQINPTTATTTAVHAAGGAGVKYGITHIHVSNAGATNNQVDIKDGTTVVWTTFAAASGGGAGEDFSHPTPLTANTAINVTTSAASSTFVRVDVVKLA